MNGPFTQREIEMSTKHMKRCSTSLAIRKMQIKTTMRYQREGIRIAKIKSSDNTKCWYAEKVALSHIADKNVYSYSGKQFESLKKN